MELDTRFQRLIGERDPEIDAHPDKARGDWWYSSLTASNYKYLENMYIISFYMTFYILIIFLAPVIIYHTQIMYLQGLG